MYDFLYEKNPAPRTVQRTWEAVDRVRQSIEDDKGRHDSYWSGYTDALAVLVEELQAFEQSLAKPSVYKKG